MCEINGGSIRWVSYTRMRSQTDSEQEVASDSINGQNLRISEFMNNNGWTICRKYSDRKNSEDATTGFEKMVQDGMRREFDGVVFDSIYRCGRNIWVAREVLQETFFPAGIQFAFADDAFCSIGKSAGEVGEYFEEKRKRIMRMNISEGIEKKAANGEMHRLLSRYGLIVSEDGKSMEIEEEGAAVVREIFSMYLNGSNVSEIARELNRRGVDSPALYGWKKTGIKRSEKPEQGKWTDAQIRNMLESPAYIGKMTFTVRDKTIEYSVPAIVSEETFNAVQEKRKSCQKPTRRTKYMPEARLLTGRVFTKEDGQKIANCLSHDKKKERNFFLKREQDSICIPFETMISAVRLALQTAGRQARYVERLLKDGEGEETMEAELSPLREQAQSIICAMDELYVRRMQQYSGDVKEESVREQEEREYQEEISKCNSQFQEIFQEAERIKKIYSVDNPWVRLYRDAYISGELNREHTEKWVDSVFVDRQSNIEVNLKESDWMKSLPAEWLAKGAVD